MEKAREEAKAIAERRKQELKTKAEAEREALKKSKETSKVGKEFGPSKEEEQSQERKEKAEAERGASGSQGGKATRHATEQSHPDEHEAPELNGNGQQMAYDIVNAFLDNVTFEITDAERLIKQVILKTGEVLPEHASQHR